MIQLNRKEMGARIRKKREEMGYSREQLAEFLDLSTKFCADIEQGARGTSLQTLANISQVLHLSTDYILFGIPTSKDMDPVKFLIERIPEKYSDSLVQILEGILTMTDDE